MATRRVALALAASALASAHPGHALAADPTMPLTSVRPGMKCTALSVLRGTTISKFSAEVIDVVRSGDGSGGARILVRVSGPTVDATGVGPGFSGSPVLCPGPGGVLQNAGAISETLGEFGNKMVLATPIGEILGQSPDPPPGARSDPALLRRARPIVSPLTVAGVSGALRSRLAALGRRVGRRVLAAPAGPLGGFPRQDLRPGSAVSAGLATGDVSVGSVGTVAYRNGAAVWAFGHPLDGVGRRALQLQDAYVFAVVGNPSGTEEASTYKLAVPGGTVGSLTNDGLGAIVGRMGPHPRTIPLTVNVRDLDTGRASQLFSRVSDERALELGSGLELVSNLATSQAVGEVLGSFPPRVTSSLCVRVRVLERRRRLGFCDTYREGGGPFDDMSQAFTLVDAFKFGTLTPIEASVRMSMRRGVREGFVLSARAPRRVRPGGRIRVRLLVQLRRGPRVRMSFRMRVPRSLRRGRRTLTLRGVVPQSLREGSEEELGVVLEDVGGGDPDEAGPRSVEDLAAQLSALGRPDGLRASFSRRGRGRVVLPADRILLRGRVSLPVRVTRPRRARR